MTTKEYFLKNNFSLVAEKNGGILFSSSEKGIKPALALLDIEQAKDCAVYDKTVGKAAAVIFVNAKVKFVYAQILSLAAKEFLTCNKIAFEYETLIEKVLNRTQTDFCPMEKTVIGENDPKMALQKLLEFVNGSHCEKQ